MCFYSSALPSASLTLSPPQRSDCSLATSDDPMCHQQRVHSGFFLMVLMVLTAWVTLAVSLLTHSSHNRLMKLKSKPTNSEQTSSKLDYSYDRFCQVWSDLKFKCSNNSAIKQWHSIEKAELTLGNALLFPRVSPILRRPLFS